MKEIIKYNKNEDIEKYNTQDRLGDKYFESLGDITFIYAKNGLEYLKQTVEEICNDGFYKDDEDFIQFYREQYYQDWIAEIMKGEEFLKCVEDGCFVDYDGTLSKIYVDGYKSNLGLSHKGITQGKFLVDGEVFKNLCKEHHVLVDWANK